jgi:DNA topoisomerase-1
MRQHGLPRTKVLATVVWLLDKTLIRVGNAEYRDSNDSYGLTTLEDQHVEAGTTSLRFAFKGKSGKSWNLKVQDRRIARIVRSCQDLPGQHLFQYLDAEGAQHPVGSHDVNDYIREIGGAFTAKHFRTWAATVTAALALLEHGPCQTRTEAARTLNAALDRVAARLVSTRAISRKCYVHPEIMTAWGEGALVDALARLAKRRRRPPNGLSAEEAMVLGFLKARRTA